MSPPTGIGQYSENQNPVAPPKVLSFFYLWCVYWYMLAAGRRLRVSSPTWEVFFRRIYSHILVMAGGSVNLLTRAGIKLTQNAVAVTEGTLFLLSSCTHILTCVTSSSSELMVSPAGGFYCTRGTSFKVRRPRHNHTNSITCSTKSTRHPSTNPTAPNTSTNSMSLEDMFNVALLAGNETFISTALWHQGRPVSEHRHVTMIQFWHIFRCGKFGTALYQKQWYFRRWAQLRCRLDPKKAPTDSLQYMEQDGLRRKGPLGVQLLLFTFDNSFVCFITFSSRFNAVFVFNMFSSCCHAVSSY
jgi:hypothetical protein